MRVSVFGLGYVGCVTAACLAGDGHTVIGVDSNPAKVDLITCGQSPIMEPGLGELIADALAAQRLRATVDHGDAVAESDLSMICVGSPSRENGSNDTTFVARVCRQIGAALRERDAYHVVAVRSTVLPGTALELLVPLLEEESGRRAGIDFGVCMNPEFLREGVAIADYHRPSYVVVGQLDERSGDAIEQAYAALDAPVIRTSLATAELVKYASNAFHALKTAFANEVGNVCKVHGIDGQALMAILCRDDRLNISPAYLRPGFAFGGSCLPKDLRALLHRIKEVDLETPVLRAILPSNDEQLRRAIWMIERTGCTRVGVLGLSFKAATDDVRESPSVPLVEALVGKGYDVSVYDETVDPDRLTGVNRAFLESALPHIARLMRPSIPDLVGRAEVVVVANGTRAFEDVPRLLRADQVLIDLVGASRPDGEIRGAYEGICW